MLAFYACTNTQIINMINVKLQFYRNVGADLYILKKNRVDLGLVKCIEEARIFKAIIIIDPYILPQNRLFKIFSLFVAHIPNKYYKKIITKASKDKCYDKFITFGFWADTLYVLNIFYEKNKDIIVEFVEEGMINYFFDKGRPYFCRTYGGIKEKIIRLLAHGLAAFKLKRNITRMYVYRPDLVESNYCNELKQINNQNEIIQNIVKIYQNKKKGFNKIYDQVKFVYLLDNFEFDMHIYILKEILSYINEKDLVIKLHPENTKDEVERIYYSFPNTYIDNNDYCFEINMVGKDKIKAFISRSSTFAYSFKYIFGIKKSNLLLYKIFNKSNAEIISFADKFFMNIGDNNIVVIKNVNEIKNNLMNYIREVQNNEKCINDCC